MKFKIRIDESQDLKLMYLCGKLNIKINNYCFVYDREEEDKLLEIDIDDLYNDLINVLFIDDIVKPEKLEQEIKTKINPKIDGFSELKKVILNTNISVATIRKEYSGEEWIKIIERLDYYTKENTATIAIGIDCNKLLHDCSYMNSEDILNIKSIIQSYYHFNESEKMSKDIEEFYNFIKQAASHQKEIEIGREYD